MTSFTRFYNLQLNMYDVIGDVTDRLKKSEITFFLKQQCSRLPKYSIPSITIQINVKNKQEFKFQLNMPFKMLLSWQHQTPLPKFYHTTELPDKFEKKS